jgi:hypothetical protein
MVQVVALGVMSVRSYRIGDDQPDLGTSTMLSRSDGLDFPGVVEEEHALAGESVIRF